MGSAKESVPGNWAAVSQALRQRLSALHMSQAALGRKAKVSKQIVAELFHNSKQRDRSDHILEALSRAVNRHPGYLAAIRDSKTPPAPDEPEVVSDQDIPGRLAAMEHNQRMTNRLLAILLDTMSKNRRMDELSPEFQAIIRQALEEFNPPDETTD
jgi:transcriptional regulator with XRE-family HTH domain